MPAISCFETCIPNGYELRSNSQETFSPVSVVVRDQIHDHLVAHQRPRQFWLSDEKAVLDLVPLARLRRKWHTEIRRPVSLARRRSSSFQSRSATVAPAAVGGDQQRLGLGVLGSAPRAPPPPDAFHRDGRRVVVRPDVGPARIAGDVEDPVLEALNWPGWGMSSAPRELSRRGWGCTTHGTK